MHLNKLILNNIGPYLGTHELDFNKLDNTLFLITGNTGAGKTYLFDAISFALYGVSSGGVRRIEDYKSKYASDTSEASVYLSFSVHDKNYQIKRVLKKVKRLDEYKVNVEALLTLPNGQIITKLKEVKEQIETILNLSFEQFRMVMLIAQGDFYSLINAKSEDRVIILRKILNTGKLNEFILTLADMLKAKKEEVKVLFDSLMHIRARFALNEELMLKVNNPNILISELLPLIEEAISKNNLELEIKKQEYANLDKLILQVNQKIIDGKINNENLIQYRAHKDKYDNIIKLKPEFDLIEQKLANNNKAKDAIAAYDNYLQMQGEIENFETLIVKDQHCLEAIKARLLEAEKKAKECLLAANDVNKYEIRKKELEGLLVRVDDYLKLLEETENLEQEVSIKEKALKEMIAPMEELLRQIKELELICKTDSKREELLQETTVLNTLKNENKQLLNNKKIIDDYLTLADNLKAQMVLEENKHQLALQKENEYLDYDNKYHLSIAGVLASKLVDGVACPVCGSLHHPHKALSTEKLNKMDLDIKKKASEDAINDYNAMHTKNHALIAILKEKKQTVETFFKKTIDVSNVLEIYNKMLTNEEENIKSHQIKYDALALYEKKREDASKSLRQYQIELTALETKRDTILKNINDTNVLIAKAKGRLSELKPSNTDKDCLKKEILTLKNKIDTINKNLNDSNLECEKLKIEMAKINSRLETNSLQMAKKKNALKELIASLNMAIKKAGYHELKEAQADLLEKDVELAFNQKVNNYKLELRNIEYILGVDCANGYDKLTPVDLNTYNAELATKTKEKETINEEKIALSSSLINNRKTLNELNLQYQKYEKTLTEMNELSELDAVASGKIGVKINFEVYYQKQIFDEIIKVASSKFNKMSDGRYELIPGEAKDKKSQAGLEIAVYDLFNGTTRPVDSLSGGESFQASMSLALAFAEIIETKAGGVELNSMFIDEGFGTLDEAMLENTKRTLLEIGNETNRRIGIISHIEELERSIPSKVIVHKTSKGSSFTIVNE